MFELDPSATRSRRLIGITIHSNNCAMIGMVQLADELRLMVTMTLGDSDDDHGDGNPWRQQDGYSDAEGVIAHQGQTV